jgi:hypothetical protein
MENEFVTYDLALRMKALGFNEPCLMVYNYKKQVILNNKIPFEERTNQPNPYLCTAPLFSQAFRWFRDEYKSFHEVFIDCEPRADVPLEDDLMFAFTIHRVREDKFIVGSRNIYKTHEEAELACLEKLIEIVEGIES